MIIVVPLVLLALIQGAIILHHGIKGGVIFSVFVSILATFLWHLFLAWAEGQKPNGALFDRPLLPFIEVLITFIICLSAMAILSFGIYYLVEFHKTGLLNKPVFFTWLAVLILPPTTYYGIKWGKEYFKEKDRFENYIVLSLKIFHYNDYPLYVDQVKFVNTDSGKETMIEPENKGIYYNREALEKMELSEKIDVTDHIIYDKRVEIPLGTDEVVISFYSFSEDRYYSDTFSYSFDQPNLLNKYTGDKIAQDLDILLKPDGKADFIFEKKKILPYTKIQFSSIGPDKKIEFLERFRLNESVVTPEDLYAAVDEINTSGRLQKREEMNEKLLRWQLSVQCKGTIDEVRIQDLKYFSYRDSYNSLSEVHSRALPSEIGFYIYNEEEAFCNLYFRMDIEKMYDIIKTQMVEEPGVSIEFSLIIHDIEKDKIQFFIKSAGHQTEFKDWIINIVEY